MDPETSILCSSAFYLNYEFFFWGDWVYEWFDIVDCGDF
jgi:hypothetical protein